MAPKWPPKLCLVCGTEIPRKRSKQVLCGRACLREQKRRLNPLGLRGQACKVPWTDCRACGVTYLRKPQNKLGRFCPVCCAAAKGEPKWYYDRGPRSRRPTARLTCAECGGTFEGTAGRRYCCQRCGDKASKRTHQWRRRRHMAATRGESFTIREIAERDGWRCHICGRRVTKTGWSVDHLVPVSQGGPHIKENVALAHRTCNSDRGVTGAAQLRLFG